MSNEYGPWTVDESGSETIGEYDVPTTAPHFFTVELRAVARSLQYWGYQQYEFYLPPLVVGVITLEVTINPL
jgi:hypothetical protein